jgi:sugar (pentulose or hexulose) kinase
MKDILAVDVGTTAFKIGVFSSDLEKRCETSRNYQINLYDHGKADIEPEKWWWALHDSCAELKDFLSSVGVVSFSVTTPGFVPMDENGSALGPAILMLDGRSHKQAREIREKVGEEKFLRETCNLPVSGGSSLCSILWIRENQPEIWDASAKFGHCNTYMVKRFTGEWAIDPSTTSITGLYNTARHDLTWNRDVLALAEISESKLPPLMQSYHKVGKILPEVARELGLPEDGDVLCGGNDAVIAALSGGFTSPGDINNICGTCEITNVCVDRPVSSRNFNVRCHVIPNRWVTFFVLNTGGMALDWFHSLFCREMTQDQFYNEYVPSVLDSFLGSDDPDRLEADLPDYVPFLQGCRYSLEQMTASFSGLTLETTREKMLLGMIKGNAVYHGEHLKEVAKLVKLGRTVMTTGGGAKIRGFLEAKKRWTGDFEYLYQDQSSLLGAAMLGQFYLTGKHS